MPKGPVIISSTTDSEDAAYGLAAGALAARLGASAHIVGPVVGVYRWEGSVRTSREWRVEIRTTADRVAALTVYLKENHTYELPERNDVVTAAAVAEPGCERDRLETGLERSCNPVHPDK